MEYIRTVFTDKILKAIISNPKSKDCEYKKIVLHLKNIGGSEKYQIERFHDKQVFHENIDVISIQDVLAEMIEQGEYKQLDAWGETTEYMIKVSKKGKESLIKKRIADNKSVSTTTNETPKIQSNNREKKYILK